MRFLRRGRHARFRRPPHRAALGLLTALAVVAAGTATLALRSPAAADVARQQATPPLRMVSHRPPPAARVPPVVAQVDPPGPAPQVRTLAAYLDSAGRVLFRPLAAWGAYEEAVRQRLTVDPRHPSGHPRVPEGSGEGRRVVYSNSQQRVWLVEASGWIHDSYLVSGRRGVPRPGTYQVYSKSEVAWAGHDGITMRYMVRFAHGRKLAIGFHSIPVTPGGNPLQTEEDLGSFRSAGCVRQSLEDALTLWEWAPLGTYVVVLP